MISAVISPDALLFYVWMIHSATNTHTDSTHPFYIQQSLHRTIKLLDILSKLAQTLMC